MVVVSFKYMLAISLSPMPDGSGSGGQGWQQLPQGLQY
jgi:hypothetical protein